MLYYRELRAAASRPKDPHSDSQPQPALLDEDAMKSKSLDELYRDKALFDSAYHPDTLEKVFLPGRMA